MINPYTIIGALVLWGATIAGAGWWAYGAGKDSEIASQAKIDKARQETREAAQLGAAEAISKIEIKQQTIVQKVQHEVQTNTVYRDCVVPADGVRLLNDAISGRGEARPAGSGPVPSGASKPE